MAVMNGIYVLSALTASLEDAGQLRSPPSSGQAQVVRFVGPLRGPRCLLDARPVVGWAF